MWSASPKPDPSKPHPCNMPQAKTKVALQFAECCAAGTALQHCLFCSAEAIWTKSCAAANEKLHCNIEKAALQESGAFLPLSCGFQAPTFRHPRFGPADVASPEPNHMNSCRSWVWGVLRKFGADILCFLGLSSSREATFWPGPSAEMCRGFLLYNFWRILPGIFLEDFSGHFFPQKRGEKIRRRNPRKNPAAQK